MQPQVRQVRRFLMAKDPEDAAHAAPLYPLPSPVASSWSSMMNVIFNIGQMG
jgi:hypothetical protein